MRYISTFKTLNSEDDIYVYIGTNGDKIRSSEDRKNKEFTELVLGGTPITISLNSDSLFDTIKELSATIRIVSTSFFPDMFQGEVLKNTVLIYNNTKEKELFYGYITPCVYNQEWQYLTEIEIECISPISALEYFDYSENIGIVSWYNILKNCILKTPYYKKFYFPNNYSISNSFFDIDNDTMDVRQTGDDFLNYIYQNENNFFDDDDEHTPWSCKSVIEEFCKFMGISLIEFDGNLYFLDYNRLNKSEDRSFVIYDLENDTFSKEDITDSIYTIIDKSHRNNDPEISYEELYNKITVRCNMYYIENVFPNLLDDENLECLHPNIKYIKETLYLDKDKVVVSGATEQPEDGYTLINVYRFYRNKKYNHRFWRRNTLIENSGDFSLVEIPNLKIDTDTTDNTEALGFFKSLMYYYCGALIMKNDSFLLDDEPSSLNLQSYLIMNTGVHSKNTYNQLTEQWRMITPVLEMKPEYTTNVPAFKGNGSTHFLVNYSCIPNDYIGTGMSYRMDDKKVGKGQAKTNYPGSIRVQLICGDYVCNGSSKGNPNVIGDKGWTNLEDAEDEWNNNYNVLSDIPFVETPMKVSTVSEIDLKPEGGTTVKGSDISVKNICSWEDYIGEDGWLSSSLGYHSNLINPGGINVQGEINIKLLTPRISDYAIHQSDNDGKVDNDYEEDTDYDSIYQYCLFKNIKINLYHSKEYQIDQVEEISDVLYTIIIDNDYVLEFNDIELRVNTQPVDKNFSYSSVVCKLDNGIPFYIDNLIDKTIGKSQLQEWNLIEKYYNHYKTPKIRYDATLEDTIKPWTLTKEQNLNKIFTLNSYEFNVHNESKYYYLIEY